MEASALTSTTSGRGRVMVVEDDARLRFGLAASLRAQGYEVVEASRCDDAKRAFADALPDVVLLDLQLPDGEALQLLPLFRARDASLPVYIITGHGSIEAAVRAVKEGAEDFLTKPVSQATVSALVERAVAKRAGRLGAEVPGASAPAMRELEREIERLRNADCTVLILGETGTGKSMLARRIHTIGARADKPFVDVNCAGLTRELVEAELFGHERGAFTGAHAAKQGLLDAANGGTLFLDEIGDIDVQVQPKILKVIEEKRFRRMGDVRERTADVRLVAATHHDLLAAVPEHRFRADLYYRISTVTLIVPPLRERREDILALAEQLAERVSGRRVGIEPRAAERLLAHDWPGNIRELKNVVERALLLEPGDVVTEKSLRFDAPSGTRDRASAPPPGHDAQRLLGDDATGATREEVERAHIRAALEAEGGRVEATARRLGIPRSTLYWKLKNYGITPPARAPRSRR